MSVVLTKSCGVGRAFEWYGRVAYIEEGWAAPTTQALEVVSPRGVIAIGHGYCTYVRIVVLAVVKKTTGQARGSSATPSCTAPAQ